MRERVLAMPFPVRSIRDIVLVNRPLVNEEQIIPARLMKCQQLSDTYQKLLPYSRYYVPVSYEHSALTSPERLHFTARVLEPNCSYAHTMPEAIGRERKFGERGRAARNWRLFNRQRVER